MARRYRIDFAYVNMTSVNSCFLNTYTIVFDIKISSDSSPYIDDVFIHYAVLYNMQNLLDYNVINYYVLNSKLNFQLI